ncbi:hypothetical protein SESBI_38492 [Sesbania bispinosa]|nr:hypothetical protein SESBI_38492 [Sesbania bispinosa]
MSGDDLSDSQDLSLNVSLSSDEDTSVTESDSLLGSSDTDSSITSRLPPLQTSLNRVSVPHTPIINLSDEGSPVMNVEGTGDEDPSLSQGLEVHPTDPKVYTNFLSEVADHTSRYTSVSSIVNFRKHAVITSLDLDKTILIEPCNEHERICDSYLVDHSVPLYTYLYDTFFTKLNLRLPFSTFERGLLHTLNIPPSQLHPNSWAFVRAYQIMCRHYSLVPDLEKFFAFFQVKLPSSHEIGVRGIDASSDLLFNSDGVPHFPLFWSLEPHRVPQTPLSALSEDDRAAVEWLRMQKNIDCCALLENEDNPAGLQALLGNMPPKSQMTKPMDEVAMLKALGAKERKTKAAEKNAATSVECLGAGPVQHADGTNSLEQRKKQKINEGNQPGDTGTRPPPSSSNQNALNNPTPSPTSGVSDKWWALLNDYEGSTSDVCSLFDRRYPIDQIVDKHFNLKEDRTRVQKVGMKNLGKKIQSGGSQMAFFGLCVDQYVSSAEKEVKKLLLKNRELTEKLKNHEDDMKTVEKLKTDLLASENQTAELLVEKETWIGKFSSLEKKNGDLQKKNDDLVTKNIDLENKLTKLTSDKEALIVERGSLIAELEDTKAQVAMQHAAGFEKAVNQLQFLYPDLKTDEVGAFKHIVDGKLVDITIDEDEE